MTVELDAGRRRARRRWAAISFAFIMVTGLLTFGVLLFSNQRKEIAEALMIAAFVINAFLSVAIVIILGYLGFSHADQRLASSVLNGESDDDTN